MSGIAGIIHFDGRPVEPEQIEAMTGFMSFRGPDGINHWRRGNVALGQCMLRTTPESLEEVQPLTNEDESLVLVMDGRVDNWEELRELLLRRKASLRTRADAELVLRAYEVWGEDCVKEIDGDFAFVIWDVGQRRAFCARDRFGNKPFHYNWNGTTLTFASDLRPVLDRPWVGKAVDENTLAEYLAADFITLETTLWADVRRLRASHTLRLDGATGPKFKSYWAPDLAARLPCITDADFVQLYRERFFDAVRRTGRSHRKLTIEVSGGLDSSAIFGVAHALQSQGQLLAPGFEGYTLNFEGDPNADELAYVRAVSQHTGRSVHCVDPANQPLSWYADVTRRFQDFPHYPNGAMGLSIAQQGRAAGSCVLMAGTGGDEWAGGARVYYADALREARLADLASFFTADVKQDGLRAASSRLLRTGVMPVLPHGLQDGLRALRRQFRGQIDEDEPVWLSPEIRRTFDRLLPVRASLTARDGSFGQQRQSNLLVNGYWHMAKQLMERNLALAGTEWRQPFWTRRMVETAFAMPSWMLHRGQQNKWLHRQAMTSLLPERVCQRNDKATFGVAFHRTWPTLRTALARDVLPRRTGWVNGDTLLRILDSATTDQRLGWAEGPPWHVFFMDLLVPGEQSALAPRASS